MAAFALDSSCMVAAVCTWHEHHRPAAKAIERRLARGERLAIAAHALLETYAVLTRLPAPHRLAPAEAWTLINANFVAHATVVALKGAAHPVLLDRLASLGIAGGRTYDGVIAECAVEARVDALLTFNPRHFDSLKRIAVVDPANPM